MDKKLSEYMRSIGRKGGKATAKKYGREHMKALGKASAEKQRKARTK